MTVKLLRFNYARMYHEIESFYFEPSFIWKGVWEVMTMVILVEKLTLHLKLEQKFISLANEIRIQIKVNKNK